MAGGGAPRAQCGNGGRPPRRREPGNGHSPKTEQPPNQTRARGDLPSWPLCKSASRDERLVAGILEQLGFDAEEYDRLVDEVWDLIDSRPFQRAFIASETLFSCSPVIDRRMIPIIEWAADTAEPTEQELAAVRA
jgi:hypothetical protein